MYKVGLTGGIASGKSTVVNWLKRKGVPVVDADLVARDVVEPGSVGLAAIIKYFGKSILQEDGRLDRSRLGSIVFQDEEARRALNEMLHKPIKDRFQALTDAYEQEGYRAVLYDIPLMIERNWYQEMDELWVVYVDLATQKQRLILRNGYSEAEAVDRISSQMPLKDKRAYADVLIDNNSSEEALYKQLEELWVKKYMLFTRS